MPRPGLRRACLRFGVLATTVILAGCGQAETLSVQAVPTLPPPTPLGMEQMPPAFYESVRAGYLALVRR